MCFGTRNNQFGSFRYNGQSRVVGALMLVHRQGLVKCWMECLSGFQSMGLSRSTCRGTKSRFECGCNRRNEPSDLSQARGHCPQARSVVYHARGSRASFPKACLHRLCQTVLPSEAHALARVVRRRPERPYRGRQPRPSLR